MKKNIIVFIDDDLKQAHSDFEKFSKIISKAKTGCEIVDKNKIQQLIKDLNNPVHSKENEFDKWLNTIYTQYKIMAFVLDVELKTDPLNGISILNRIRNGDFLDSTNKNQFFCDNIPIIMFTGVDSKEDEYKKSSYENKLPNHFLSKNTIANDSLTHILEEEIRKYFTLTSSMKIEENIQEILNITKDTNNKLTEITVIVKMIAKTLPQLTDNTKANNIIEDWENDDTFRQEMDIYFPTKRDGLFNKLKDFKDIAKENTMEAIYEQAVVYFDNEAEIDSDNDTKMVKFLKYSAYIVEKIGQAVKS